MAATKKAAAVEEEDYEDAVEEGGEEEVAEEASEEEEDDFRARAKKSLKKAGAKPVKVAAKKSGKGDNKVKAAKKKTKGANTSNGVARKEWATPWRPSSVLAQAFELAQKKVSLKELNAFAKKNEVEPAYVLGAMKRKKTRNWAWGVQLSDTHIKVINAHAGTKAKAA